MSCVFFFLDIEKVSSTSDGMADMVACDVYEFVVVLFRAADGVVEARASGRWTDGWWWVA